ncbi:hypothetical protein A9Q99_21405 [Gammaproteobacteria bacterium 45_16_T64]|nr:hypothetical protein A9Q99_21405 [Gammaproteobacteria bacterium 45_16_T64]
MKTKTALVTGASGGIGLEIARNLAQKKIDLVIVARGEKRLREIAQELESTYDITVVPLSYDLLKDSSANDIFEDLELRGIAIDMLVNNAGCVEYGAFAEVSEEDVTRMLLLNNQALVRMVHRFLPGFIENDFGRILNVSSITGFQPTPFIAIYGATKAFVLSFTEALSIELQGTGVKVTALCPGVTDTGMIQSVNQEHSDKISIPKFITGDPKNVAKSGVNASFSGKVIEVPGIGNKMAVNAAQIPPKWIYRKVSSLLTKIIMK